MAFVVWCALLAVVGAAIVAYGSSIPADVCDGAEHGEGGGPGSCDASGADASLLQVLARNRSWNAPFCPTGCCASTCEECMQYSDAFHESGSCRWCPTTQSCHNIGSPMSKCNLPINSLGQCWGVQCPYQIGALLSLRPDDAMNWVSQTLIHSTCKLQTFRTYSGGATGLFDLISGQPLANASDASPANRIIVVGSSDWGSGTCEARVVGGLMQQEDPHVTLHLGDVYFTGTPEEFNTNMLGIPPNDHQIGVAFPKGSHTTFFMNGNHEMISGGNGLMENGFGYTGQTTTYGAWLSDHWRFIALDTGYLSYKMNEHGHRNAVTGDTDAPNPAEVITWLRDIVRIGDPNDKRGIVLFSHHDPFSDWSTSYLGTAKQLSEILPAKRTVIWFYGHDHELSFYSKMQLKGTNFYTIPRMVGNGGFADKIQPPVRSNSLIAWDSRVYQEIPTFGKNSVKVGFNGYFRLLVEGREIRVTYITGACKEESCEKGFSETSSTTVAEETLTLDPESGNVKAAWTFMHPDLTNAALGVHPMAQAGPGEIPVEDTIPWNESQGTLTNLEHATTD